MKGKGFDLPENLIQAVGGNMLLR